MKKIINFIRENWHWLLLIVFVLVVLVAVGIPLVVYITKYMWDLALKGPLPQY
jgi:Kef-type K+ transport system membrane component KefB